MMCFFQIFILLVLPIAFATAQNDAELKSSMARGADIFIANCSTCHQPDGEGIEGVYPPLAKSDYLMGDKRRAIKQVLEGAIGDMTVNGITYNGFMAGVPLTDTEVRDVLNYIRNSWGNHGDMITTDQVKSARQ